MQHEYLEVFQLWQLFCLQLLARLDSHTCTSYQITAGRAPIVQPRDFVFVTREEEREGGVWMAGGVSINTAEFPPTSRYVRAWQYPGVMVATPLADNKCVFTWLLQCEFGGFLTPAVLNIALPYAVKLFCSSIKSEIKRRKK